MTRPVPPGIPRNTAAPGRAAPDGTASDGIAPNRGSLKPPDPDALLCALVLAPAAFPRNRFFRLFEDPTLRNVRRRAKLVRGIIRQLAGHAGPAAEIVGEQVLEDRVLLRFQLPNVNYQRTTSLEPLEAALVQFAVQKAKNEPCDGQLRQLLERTLARLEINLDLIAQASTKTPSVVE